MMHNFQWHGEVGERHVLIYMTGALCTQPAQILQSEHAVAVIQNFLNELRRRNSQHLQILKGRSVEGTREKPSPAAQDLARALALLCDLEAAELRERAPDLADLVEPPLALADLVEELYDHWRRYERYLLLETRADDSRDSAIAGHRPFIFNNQDLNSLVRDAYRRIERNLRGRWPRVYRQVPAGANMSLLVERINWQNPGGLYEQLSQIRLVRLALLVPPVTLYPRRTRRKGKFLPLERHPLAGVELDPERWLCLPIEVGELHFLFFFEREFMALATSLVNLFELSGHEEARKKPDGIVLFGLPADKMGVNQTAFYIDEENDIVLGAIGKSEDVDYFGYCKKMTLTLHNIIMMRRGRMPVHGAMCRLRLRDGTDFTVVIVGDSGAGKSETLEAFRELAEEYIADMTIIFDDMGSLRVTDKALLGYGTEIGAFVRLDELAPGYAFKHFDRAIFMNPDRWNARVVVPLTDYREIVAGYPVDLLLYANNYEQVTSEAPVLEFFKTPEEALEVFRLGLRQDKGTTDESGIVRTYFANPFGPEQLKELHEPIARATFEAAFARGVRVGQMRTRLGIQGWERQGPIEAAKALFALMQERKNTTK